MNADDRKQAHARWLDMLLRRGDDSELHAWLSTGHVLHQSLTTTLPPGPRGVKRALGQLRRIFSPWVVLVTDQLATAEHVLTRFAAHGRHCGSIGPMQPTGSWTAFNGMLLTRFAGDRAYESWLEVSALDALFALGAIKLREARS